MRRLHRMFINPRTFAGFLMLVVLCVLTPLSNATAPTLTISVVNNSQLEILHLYLAPAGTNDWGSDQLSSSISAGSSRNVDISWNQSTVKLVAEDQDGCFFTTTVEATGSPTWTITSSSSRDCGNVSKDWAQ